MPVSHRVPASFLAALLALVAGAHAQTVTFLEGPTPGQFSRGKAVWGTRQGGSTDNGYSVPRLWQGTAASGVTLTEPGPDAGSSINSLSATKAVGEGYVRTSPFDGYYAALLWDLANGQLTTIAPPPGFTGAYGFGVGGSQQVGSVEGGNSGAPALWTGSTASFVNLLPAGFDFGVATATDGVQQVGRVSSNTLSGDRAALWTGTAGSFIDLHPGPADGGSEANGVSGGRQCGRRYGPSFPGHACVWQGSAASFTDIHPTQVPEALKSEALGISGTVVCGVVQVSYFGGRIDHAALWLSPSASSFVDLNALLPAGYSQSRASAVWTDGSVIRVVGEASPDATGDTAAVMWTITSTAGTCCVGQACQIVASPAACAGVFGTLGGACGPLTCCAAPMGTLSTQDCDGDLLRDACTTLAPQADCNAASGPDSCETLITTETNFRYNPGPYTVNGAASADYYTYALLTPAEGGLQGSLVMPALTTGPTGRLRAIFDFRLTVPAGATAGDGFSFALLNDSVYTVNANFGEDGPGAASLAVKFNTFANTPAEGSNSMFIRSNGVDVAQNLVLPFTLANGQWHRCVVDVTPGGRVTVRLGTNPGDMTTVFNSVQVPGYTPFRALIGFGGRTGGAYEEQAIRAVRIGVSGPNDLNGDGIPDACVCPADFNTSGHLDVQDIFAFLTAWFAGDPRADFNHTGGTNVQDIFDFLAAWFAGCP